MAIGSAPEIGTQFGTIDGWLGDRAEKWRESVGGNLLGGYATLHKSPRGAGNRHSIGNPEESQP